MANKQFLGLILLTLASALLAACGTVAPGSPGDSEPPPPVQKQTISIAISPTTASVKALQTQQFQASVGGTSNTKVTWSVDGIEGGNTSVGTISSAGLYAAPAAAGNHKVAVSSVADTTKKATAAIDVEVVHVSVPTFKYDATRTGLNSYEIKLTPSNVSSHFGKLFAASVDGLVFAQPLYLPNLSMPGQGTRDVIFVATEHDSVYALDADTGQQLWQVSFIDPSHGITTVPTSVANDPGGRTGLGPEVGITGTPVIDPDTNTIYVSVMTYESAQAVHRLHALDIFTGAEKFGGPVVITASVPGNGDGNDGAGHIPFHSLTQNQRSGLLLNNGVLYIAFASFSDVHPYHGWLFAYDPQTLQQIAVLNTSPNGEGAGIWQGAAAPAADADGNIYLATADGTFDLDGGGHDIGDTLLKLKLTNGSFDILEWFTPYNQNCLNLDDLDFGAGGPALLPDSISTRRLLVAPSKEGRFYVIDRDSMGDYRSDADTQIIDWVLINSLSCSSGQLTADGHTTNRIYGSMSYFNNSVYVGAANTTFKRYTVADDGKVTLASQTPNSFQTRGAASVISASGTDNAILWVTEFATDTHQAILHAYDAMDLSHEYYSSVSTSDAIGRGVVFTVPVVANGKVYVGSEYHVTAFGLK
ncbi:MAG TPA: hypothetical protein VMT53_14430 [Terriglobales bacterium]|nr:hypothetical protein [Terriglobales bacterium]